MPSSQGDIPLPDNDEDSHPPSDADQDHGQSETE